MSPKTTLSGPSQVKRYWDGNMSLSSTVIYIQPTKEDLINSVESLAK
jgi:hypothetical protein